MRYCARPSWAASRLGKIDDDTLIYQLPPGDVHGRDTITLTPFELLDRLAQLVVPPRVHRHTFNGVFAPNAALRPLVAASAGPDPDLAIRLHDAARKMGIELDFEQGPSPQDEQQQAQATGRAQTTGQTTGRD